MFILKSDRNTSGGIRQISVVDTKDGVVDAITEAEAKKYLLRGIYICGLGLNRENMVVSYDVPLTIRSLISTKSKLLKDNIYLTICGIDKKMFALDTDKGVKTFGDLLDTSCYSRRQGKALYENLWIQDIHKLNSSLFLVCVGGSVCVKYDIEFYLTGFDLYLIDIDNLLNKCILKQGEVAYYAEIDDEEEYQGDCPNREENLFFLRKTNKIGKIIVTKSGEVYLNGIKTTTLNSRTYYYSINEIVKNLL